MKQKKLKPTAEDFLFEIRVEALGFNLPTKRLADLIAGDESALRKPCTTFEQAKRQRRKWEKERDKFLRSEKP